MPRRVKPNMTISTVYMILYMGFAMLELFYAFLLWSSYGNTDGKLRDMYQNIKQHLNMFVSLAVVFLIIFSFFFPGVGWIAFIITLWRVADFCCGQQEGFGDGLNYGWGRYYPDSATFFNQAHIEREQDGTRSAYSSAVGDVADSYWLAQLADYENRIAHRPIQAMRHKVLVYEKDGCGYGKWIIPKLKDETVSGCGDYLCNGGCNKCTIQQYGNIFESLNTPRPLYTTSLLAKEMDIA